MLTLSMPYSRPFNPISDPTPTPGLSYLCTRCAISRTLKLIMLYMADIFPLSFVLHVSNSLEHSKDYSLLIGTLTLTLYLEP